MAIRPVQGTTDVIRASDNNNSVTYYSSSAVAVTLPAGLPTTFQSVLLQMGAGTVTVSAGSGVTLYNRQSHTGSAGQYAIISIVATSSDVAVLAGDTA